MKAFDVRYQTGSQNGVILVLAQSEEGLEEALAAKEPSYKAKSRWCKIEDYCEIPLSSVMVRDLSAFELFGMFSALIKDAAENN